MVNRDTSKELVITNSDAQKALLEWFDILSDRYASQGGKQINGRAWRAELRRMEPPFGVMMCEGYSVLLRQLSVHMPLSAVNKMALAIFISVAVHIKKHCPEGSFAAQLGEKKDEKPFLSSLRFQRLQQARDPDTFSQQLIRAVKIREDKGVNIISLADSIFLWMREWQDSQEHIPPQSHPFARNRIRWANEYISSSR
nr:MULTISPECIES: type I-E CRISPR-associated protein Cse2/CasB [unclassified Enterobacter]